MIIHRTGCRRRELVGVSLFVLFAPPSAFHVLCRAEVVTNLGSIGGAPDPTTVPEVYTGMRKLSTDQGDLRSNQPVSVVLL